jgi:RNA polymerase sigma factor (sigma-70 family)
MTREVPTATLIDPAGRQPLTADPGHPAEGAASLQTRAAPGQEHPASAAGGQVFRPLEPFDDVLTAHEVELYRYLRRLAPTADDAADLHQETFLRAFRAYDRLEAGANVRAWLYRIAGNLARDAHRRRVVREQRDPERRPDEPWDLGANPGDGPVARAEASELRDAVRASLLRLTGRQRLAVAARILDGRDYADVAAALGCSEETARQHVSQGLRRMRTMLAPWTEDGA